MTATTELVVDSAEFEKVVENELESYHKLAQFIEYKIKDELIDEMIDEYFNYFNNLKPNNIEPNDSIKLIWKIHLLHPRIYRQDCFRRFGRIIIPCDLELKFDSISCISSTPSLSRLKSCKFTQLDLKKSLFLSYQFIQKILTIKKNDINIKKWIANYKNFMVSIGNIDDKDIIKPTMETDLVWHSHMLSPNVYFKESMILSNGKFVKHIVDLKQAKYRKIRDEIINYNAKKNIINNSLMVIIMSLILAIITSYIYIENEYAVPPHSRIYVTTASELTCTTQDAMLCSYVNGLDTIFTISDNLREALNQSDFDSIRDDMVRNYGTSLGKVVFYDAGSDTLLTNPLVIWRNPFGNTSKVSQLISNYGDEICEKSDVNDETGAARMNTGFCRGWVYLATNNVDSMTKEKAPLSVMDQNGGYAILFGSIIDFDDNKLYYLYVHTLSYEDIGCRSDDGVECGKTNAQMLLGNAVFFISILGYDYYPKQQIWDAMNGIGESNFYNTQYFQYEPLNYKYYVFVNRYTDGYRYVHGESSKIDTKTSINDVVKVGADTIYGEWIEYEASSGEEKTSYIIGLYPDVFGSWRLYVGSGYSIDQSTTGSGSNSVDVGMIVGITIGAVIACCCIIVAIYCWCNRNDTTSKTTTYNSGVAMSSGISKNTSNAYNSSGNTVTTSSAYKSSGTTRRTNYGTSSYRSGNTGTTTHYSSHHYSGGGGGGGGGCGGGGG